MANYRIYNVHYLGLTDEPNIVMRKITAKGYLTVKALSNFNAIETASDTLKLNFVNFKITRAIPARLKQNAKRS